MAIHKIKIFAGRASEYLAAKIAASFGTRTSLTPQSKPGGSELKTPNNKNSQTTIFL